MSDARQWLPYDYMRHTRFNRDILDLAVLAQQFQDAVMAFEEHDIESVTQELRELGIPEEVLDSNSMGGYLKWVEDITGDAGGFRWALDMFVGILDVEKLALSENERAALESRETEEASNGAAPCAVVGGKVGA